LFLESAFPVETVRILVVDDEERVGTLIRSILEKHGYEVTVTQHGKKAIGFARQTKPSLILLDIGLPDISGLDVCKRLKHSPATSGIPVIMLTGKLDQKHINQAFEYGADDYIPKPFDVSVFEAKVRVVLQKTKDKSEEEGSFRGYRLGPKIGEGGMGVVYKAVQLALNRPVAVKILHYQFASDQEYVARFIAEARLAAALSHPNIVGAIDFGKYEGGYFFVMEYVDGKSARDILVERGVLTRREALEIAFSIADALEHARRKGLVHGDVKPANILVNNDGIPKLADLGLARTTAEVKNSACSNPVVMGTPHYIAPEQFLNQEVDSRADVYSLGATLFHMVVGCPPFTGENELDVLEKHSAEPRPWPDGWELQAGKSASAVVRKAMAIDPSQRYQTPGEMALHIQSLLRKTVEEHQSMSAVAGLDIDTPYSPSGPTRNLLNSQDETDILDTRAST
jgi:serine/threonine protein kinase